jgi:shikimate dehydrogenase
MDALFGLIGKTLRHSFSKTYFEKKFTELNLGAYHYQNFELQKIEDFPALLKAQKYLKGLNVTLPYKEEILPFIDELSEEAQAIGAVNCIKMTNGKTIGYNTDVYGFSQSIKPFLDFNHQRALILGTGGSSKAVAFALRKIGVEVLFVSSSASKKNEHVLLYEEVNELVMQSHKLLVNCTPLGMFPDIKKATENGAIVVNGLSMLKLQAEKSWELWNTN